MKSWLLMLCVSSVVGYYSHVQAMFEPFKPNFALLELEFKNLLDEIDMSKPYSLGDFSSIDNNFKSMFFEKMEHLSYKASVGKVFSSYPESLNKDLAVVYYHPSIKYNDKNILLAGYEDHEHACFKIKGYDVDSSFNTVDEFDCCSQEVMTGSGGKLRGELTGLALSSHGIVAVAGYYYSGDQILDQGGYEFLSSKIDFYSLENGKKINKDPIVFASRITALTFTSDGLLFITRDGCLNGIYFINDSGKIDYLGEFESAEAIYYLRKSTNMLCARSYGFNYQSFDDAKTWSKSEIVKEQKLFCVFKDFSTCNDRFFVCCKPKKNIADGVVWRIKDSEHIKTYNVLPILILCKFHDMYEKESAMQNTRSVRSSAELASFYPRLHSSYVELIENEIPKAKGELMNFVRGALDSSKRDLE